MKPVFVIALVLLCCCFAAKIKKPQNPFFKNQKDLFGKNVPARNQLGRAEAETKTVQVKPPPCTFSVKFYMKNFMGPGEYSGKFKKYGTNMYGTTTVSGHDTVSLLRTDIKEAGKPLSAFCFFSEMVGDQCAIQDLGFVDDYRYVQGSVSPFVTFQESMPLEFEYETEEETTWEGFKCKKYGYDGSIMYVKDDYLIGAEYAPNEMKIVLEYKFDDMREDIVLPKECKDDEIPEAAYSAPKEDKICKSKVEKIDLKELPCTYSVKETENSTYDGSTYTVSETLYKVYGTSLLEVSSEDGYVYNTLVRGDIKEAGSSTDVLVVETKTFDGECEVDDWYYDDYADYADFLPFSEAIYCEYKEDAKWEGEKCTDCAISLAHYYIKDGLFIGYNIDAPGYASKGKYEYIYEDVREELVFNKSCDLGVYDPVPENASSAPAEIKDCTSKPKSDASSSISVFASMIISMIMISLISLF